MWKRNHILAVMHYFTKTNPGHWHGSPPWPDWQQQLWRATGDSTFSHFFASLPLHSRCREAICGDFNCFTFTRKPFRKRSRRTPGGVVFASFQLWTVVGGALATSATCLPPLPAVLSNPSPRTNGMDGKNWCYTTILLNGCPGIHTINKMN